MVELDEETCLRRGEPEPKGSRACKSGDREERVTAATKLPSKPSKPKFLELRLMDEYSTETTMFVGLRQRELLPPTPMPPVSSLYAVWDLSNSKSVTLPIRYTHWHP
jgi:hypothetical protein